MKLRHLVRVVPLTLLAFTLATLPELARAQDCDDARWCPPPVIIEIEDADVAPVPPRAVPAELTDDDRQALGWRTSRAGRIAAELFGGGGIGVAGIVGGGALGLAMCGRSADTGEADFGCIVEMVFGGIIGGGVAAPLGVWGTGSMLDGNGGVGWTFLGEAAGLAAALAIAPMLDGGDSSVEVATFLILPVVGAVVGFELSSDTSASEAAALRQGLVVGAALAPTPGGATLGLTGAF